MNKNREADIATHYQTILELKQIRENVESSETVDLRFNIETSHWFGHAYFGKIKNRIKINQTTAMRILEIAIQNEQRGIDDLIDQEIEERIQDGTKYIEE